jgi:lipopolysaccharide biosynthesis glycosyltransferase
MTTTIIPIFFSFNRNYYIPAAVTIRSMLKYADKSYYYQLYVLHTELKPKDERNLQKIVNSFANVSLEFMNISGYDLDTAFANVTRYHFTKETMSRLFADILFPQYDSIIYSDVDVVFQGDVSKVWFTTLNAYYVAGVKHIHEPAPEKGAITNAGFLVMNLKKIREDKMAQQWREVMKTNQHGWNDQDIINACCEPYIGLLPLRFNICQIYYDSKIVLSSKGTTPSAVYSQEEVAEAMQNPVMIHYITGNKPWNTIFSHKQRAWLNELIGTGFVWRFIFRFSGWFLKQRKLFQKR